MDIESLQWDEFETVVAQLWEEFDYNTQVTPDGGDGGVDVIATRNEPYEERVLIQVKHYTGSTVGVSDVREYSSLLHQQHVDAVVIVTSGYFTAQAEKEAEEIGVKLIDKDRIMYLTDKHLLDTSPSDEQREYLTHHPTPDVSVSESVLQAIKTHLKEETEFINFYSASGEQISYQFAVGQHNISVLTEEQKQRVREICREYGLERNDSIESSFLIAKPGFTDPSDLDVEWEAKIAVLLIQEVYGYEGELQPEIV